MVKINEKELQELFIEIKYNNNIAFEKLYKGYDKLVYSIAFSILKNKQDADDIVQIVFTKIYTLDKDKLPSRNESSWLYSITKNETISFLRKRNNNIDLDNIYEIADDDNEINKIIDQDSYNRLISKLGDKEKEIISLKVLSNLSFNEIAKILNTPTGTIKWRYYKSIHTLKLLLSNLGMCIITFITSIAAFKNSAKVMEDSVISESNDSNITTDEDIKGNHREDTENKETNTVGDGNSNTQENIIIETPIIHSNTNYLGLSFLGISTCFFILTIIFSIIYTKHQLKRRKKASK